MKRASSFEESIALLSSLSVGRVFTDHLGQRVERESEVHVSVGPGYNGLLSIPEYVEAVTYGERYGTYVILD